MVHDGFDTAGALSRTWVRRWGATLTTVAVAMALASCSSVPTAPAPVATKTATSAPAAAAKAKATTSWSESNYATYIATLTQAQKEVRAGVSPDVLTTLSDEQITQAFTITAAEISGSDGKIDPAKFAEAWAARQNGINEAGNSLQEWPKWGGLADFGVPMFTKILNKYVPLMVAGLWGKESGDVETREGLVANLMRGATVDSVMADPASPIKPTERFRHRIIPFKDSVPTLTPNADGSIHVSELKELWTNNWPQAAMREATSLDYAEELEAPSANLDVRVDETTGRVSITNQVGFTSPKY